MSDYVSVDILEEFADLDNVYYLYNIFEENHWELLKKNENNESFYQLFFGEGIQVDNMYEYGFSHLLNKADTIKELDRFIKYRIKIGVDCSSYKKDGNIIKGSGSVYYYYSQEEYDSSNESSVADFEFKYDSSLEKVVDVVCDDAETKQQVENDYDNFIDNIKDNLLPELEKKVIQNNGNAGLLIKQICDKYNFKTMLSIENDNLYYEVYAKNTDNKDVLWFAIQLSDHVSYEPILIIYGNTDQNNIWLCDTRKDLTLNNIVDFCKNVCDICHCKLTVSPFTKENEVYIHRLVDIEDLQEIKDFVSLESIGDYINSMEIIGNELQKDFNDEELEHE